MADTLQHGSISGSASVRQRISGEITIGGKIMKELRFLPYSEFPEIGREETIYIDTDNNAMYYYDGSSYVALSGGGGGGTDNYNALTNKPSVNSVTLIGNKTSSELGLQELISDLSTIRSGASLGTTAVQPETLETALSDKQDVINDLDDIRSGASAGATAIQPSDMEAALADKQDVIADLNDIRTGAAFGATAVQPDDLETALSGKQDTISDLQTIRSGAALGATAVQPSDMETALADKQDVIDDLNDIRTGAGLGATAVQPSDMETALANKQDVISDLDAIRSGATAGNTALQPGDIDTLPTDGSSNPVSSGGTYNFVNSSIATNTAYFIGTFSSVAELEAYTGTVTNNDYAFVISTDSAGNSFYNRYKYNAVTQAWSFEYAVNNTPFTAAQWAAIQSGLTASDKTKLDGIEQGANKTVIDASPTSGSSNAVSSGGVHTALSGKQDTIADLPDIRSGASAGATAVQPSALNDYQTKLSGTNKLDPAYIEYDASHRAVSDAEKTTWNGKQDTISDLSTIRSGAAAGATALQQSDVSSTYSATGTAPVNGTAVNAAIGTLDVSSVGGSGKYISAISEADGKISATPTSFDTSLSSSSTDSNAPTSKTVFDDQQRQEAEIGDVANAGAKNILRFTAKTETVGGVTFTVNADGSVTLNGTKTNNDWFYLSVGNELKKGTYIISSGLPAQNDYSVRLLVSTQDSLGSAIMVCAEQQQTKQYTLDQDYSGLYYAIRVSSGTTIDNLTIKPMLRLASITDSTFVPYAKTNRELTATEDEDRAALIEQVDSGAKNLVAWDIATVRSLNQNATWTSDDTCVKGGITYKFNTDGTVVANGTADASGSKYIKLKSNFSVAKGLIASCGLPAVSQDQSKGLLQLDYPTGSDLNVYDYEISKEVDRDGTVDLYITVLGGITVSNLIFKPMICTAADWAVSQKFVPYRPSWQEMWEMIQALQNNS